MHCKRERKGDPSDRGAGRRDEVPLENEPSKG